MRTTGWGGQPLEVIDWKEEGAKKLLEQTLKEMLENKKLEISIKNIVSSEFIDLYDVSDPDDFNGWQCDWWSHMYYEGIKFAVSGGAFYGKIGINHWED